MAAPLGIATFPGLQQIVQASYTLSHGITPGVATVEIAPQPGLTAAAGPLVFTFGSVQLVFPDCRINEMSYRRNDAGLIWALQIFDRRWKWQFGEVTGHYNLRHANETLDTSTAKTPQQLATLLLQAMGESRFNVGDLPNETRPEVHWDYANPAQELADLCESLSCTIVLQLDNTVRICRAGQGGELPAPPVVMDDSASLDLVERPDWIRWVGGPTQAQFTFSLEAVGLDTDDKVVPINNLSYKPADGWNREIAGRYWGVEDTNPPGPIGGQQRDNPRNPRTLAKNTVWRWYRIKEILGNVNWDQLLGREFGFRLERIDQLLPLTPELLLTDETRTPKKRLPALVQGVFRKPDTSVRNTTLWAQYERPFDIDVAQGIVKFADYVYQWSEGLHQPNDAELYLTCICSLKHQTTGALHRVTRTYLFGGQQAGAGPQVIREDETALTIRLVYDNNGGIRQTITNESEVNPAAQYALATAVMGYQVRSPRNMSYAGLLPINPDGAIQQVSWSVVEGQGATTRASRNHEFSLAVPSYKERRMLEKLRNDKLGHLTSQSIRLQKELLNLGRVARG